jgi:hypothetical protein
MMMRLLRLTAGAVLLFVGFVQSFWGNDPYLGWAISLVASAYLTLAGYDLLAALAISDRTQRVAGFAVFLLIMWIALGVGELPEKTAMMLEAFPYTKITGI